MKTLNKFLSLLVITLMVVPMSLVPSVASAVTPKINICHKTSSLTNPWNAIQIANDAWSDHQSHGDFYYGGNLKDDGSPDMRGANTWCKNNVPLPVNGGWSEWSPSACPTAPGSPETQLTRTCTNPTPAYGGADCVGESTQLCPAIPEEPVDVCPDVQGLQTSETECSPVPPQCTPNNPMIIYSTVGDSVDDSLAVATWTHGAWASIPDATWIWHEAQVTNPTSDEIDVFTKTINITGNVTGASIDIATDNGYKIEVNDVLVVDNLAVEANYSPVVTHNITNLQTGANTLKITVKNFALADSTYETNPAGLLYKLTVNTETCPDPEPKTATIVAQKIVCDSESDLPNWGDGQSSMQQITSNTASRYVNAHPTCRLVDWTFEKAPSDASNPGDNVSSGGASWTSFTNQTTVPSGSKVWIREQVNSDYVPFSGDTSSDGGWDSVSAEMYCHTDVLNYDNYDWVDPVVAGETYYCLAFNTLKEELAPQTSTVKMCKIDGEQKPLSGWNLMLLGDKYGSVSVKPDGTDYKLTSVPVGNYVLKASGEYTYRPGSVGAEYSDAAYSKRLSSDVVYQTALLDSIQSTYLPWVRENNFPNPYTGWLGIIFNNEFTDWGSMYNPNHTYALGFSNPSVGDFSFKILDDVYGDNSGSLTLDVYQGYQDYTGEDGCVTFTDVPYGTYTTDEIMQDGWSNVSGLGEVVVNEESETFMVVNHDDSVPPAPVCNPEIELIKNGSFENNSVLNSEKWNIFASGTTGLEWLVEWFGGSTSYNDSTRPEVANIELHNGVNSWLPFVGSQYAELDTDWFGPTSPLNGEPASVAISQDITTVPGTEYQLTYNFSPRPNTVDAENVLEVFYNGESVLTVGPIAGGTNTSWTPHSFKFTATSTNTRITFRDAGVPNDSLGTFLDDVSMKCVLPNKEEPIVCEEGTHLEDTSCIPDRREPEDVCENIEGVQESIPNGMVLQNENQCVNPPSQPNPPSNPPMANGPINFGFVASGNGMVLGESTGEVLGASCGLYMERYLRLGSKKNDPEQVKKLQEFLNKWMGSNLPITGYYGPLTLAVLKEFQAKYGDDILKPWNLNVPTGLVYLSTLRKINNLECPDVMPNLPELVPWSVNPNVQ